MQTPTEYIASKGFEHKLQSGQLVLKACPFCHDEKWHFYISPNEGGPFFCHKCNERGNLWKLKQHFGDIEQPIRQAFQRQPQAKTPPQDMAEKYHKKLLGDPEARAYLHGRGFTDETISLFKLGVCEKTGTKYLSIPHYRNDKLVNIKFRSLPPADKTFRRIPDCPSILFNGDILNDNAETVYIAEGELDAIALAQAGISNVVSGTTGAGSFDPDWLEPLKAVKKIFICYDADGKGQEGARILAKRLGYNRCLNIVLPDGQDVNEFFQGHDIFEFQNLANQARPFELPGVVSTATAFDLLRQEASRNEASGLLTPWPTVNRFIHPGLMPGDLAILSAYPKIGKTTLALEVSTFHARAGAPSLFYCLEMRPERLMRKVIQAELKKSILGPEDIDQAERQLSGLPLFLAHSFKRESLDSVLSLIREAIKRYDLKLVVFDNLHFLVRSVGNVNEELGQAVQGFKLLAEEMEIPIIAIAQPRKRDSNSRDEIMRADDIRGSAAFHSDCDMMLIMHRKRVVSKAGEIDADSFTAKTESLDPVTLLRVEAHRYGSGGEALLYFHGEYSRFDMLEKKGPEGHWTDNY